MDGSPIFSPLRPDGLRSPDRAAPAIHHWPFWRRGRWIALSVWVFCLGLTVPLGIYTATIYWPGTPSGPTKKITITPGESLHSVTTQLTRAGLIRHPFFFEVYTKISGTSAKVQAGEFSVPEHISGKDLAALLGVAEVEQVSLRFQEGWRTEEMGAYLDERKVGSLAGKSFIAEVEHPTTDVLQKLGVSLPSGSSLEGFLFPDTYLVERDTTVKQLIDRMVATYRERVTPSIVSGFREQGLSEYEGVILASIVEREGRSPDDRAVVAGILLKRLHEGTPLYVDATLQYALGYSSTEGRWWRQGITADDLAWDTPFNTRLHAGLPTQPICNPSLEALEAVAHPQTTPYLYYMHDEAGVPHYAKTLAEHNANVAKYLQ